jgi:DNA-directed RNA polymerase subunit RPC12/RpoP
MATTDKPTFETMIRDAFLRGSSWIRENPTEDDAPYVQKAARDYADKLMNGEGQVADLVREARNLFREYEALYMDKPQNPNTEIKAQRNRIIADKLDVFLEEKTSIINCPCGSRVGHARSNVIRCPQCNRELIS